jgi:hypothetical protein
VEKYRNPLVAREYVSPMTNTSSNRNSNALCACVTHWVFGFEGNVDKCFNCAQQLKLFLNKFGGPEKGLCVLCLADI